MEDDCTELTGIPAADLVAIALAPESMTSDNQSYTERSVDDLIKLDNYIRQKKAACRGAGGWGQIRINKVVSPSSV